MCKDIEFGVHFYWFNITDKPLTYIKLFLYQDIGTAIVSDTTDDLWFLNESVSEQFGVGIKVEATDTEQTSEELGKIRDKKVCLGTFHLVCLYVHIA